MTVSNGIRSGIRSGIRPGLNPALGGYPLTAGDMRAAVGFGTWSIGWLCDESSGNLAPAFGATSLTPIGTPTYGTAGPRGGADKAVGFAAATDAFSGGDILDVGAAEDLAVLVVYKVNATSADVGLIGKKSTLPGWYLRTDFANSRIRSSFGDGTNGSSCDVNSVFYSGWGAVCFAFSRGDTAARIGAIDLATRAVTLGTVNTTIAPFGALTNAANFQLGDQGFYPGTGAPWIAGAYVGVGVGAAAGMPANLGAVLSNFASALQG